MRRLSLLYVLIVILFNVEIVNGQNKMEDLKNSLIEVSSKLDLKVEYSERKEIRGVKLNRRYNKQFVVFSRDSIRIGYHILRIRKLGLKRFKKKLLHFQVFIVCPQLFNENRNNWLVKKGRYVLTLQPEAFCFIERTKEEEDLINQIADLFGTR